GAGQETLELGTCDTRALVAGVVAEMTSAADARAQRLETTIGRGAESVRADAAKLHDVLRNLVANAISYSPERSIIRIEAQPAAEGRVDIVVSDEGPGIPDEDLSRVFE